MGVTLFRDMEGNNSDNLTKKPCVEVQLLVKILIDHNKPVNNSQS